MAKRKPIKEPKSIHIELGKDLYTMLKLHVAMKESSMASFARDAIKDKLSGSGVRT